MRPIILSNSEIGTHAGNITKRAESAISKKYLLGTFGSSSANVKICGASDLPIGVITDEAAAKDEIVNVALLGGSDTLKAIANESITAGARLTLAADGQIKSLDGATSGNHTMIGIALTSATVAGQVIEFISCVPQQYTIA